MDIPHILLPIGTIIEIGEDTKIHRTSWGCHIELRCTCNHTSGNGHIKNANVIKNPNGWHTSSMSHGIRSTDKVIHLPKISNREMSKTLLEKEY